MGVPKVTCRLVPALALTTSPPTPPPVAPSQEEQWLWEHGLNAFRNVRLIGKGASAEVFEVEITLPSGRVIRAARKVIENRQGYNQARLDMEVAALRAGAGHPNVVQLHAVAREEGRQEVLMELLEGQTLEDIIVRGWLLESGWGGVGWGGGGVGGAWGGVGWGGVISEKGGGWRVAGGARPCTHAGKHLATASPALTPSNQLFACAGRGSGLPHRTRVQGQGPQADTAAAAPVLHPSRGARRAVGARALARRRLRALVSRVGWNVRMGIVIM